jgi:hypothetical protein
MTTLLDTHQAALRLGLARATLAKYRVVGGGPPFVKLGAKVLYPEPDLAAWLAAKPRQFSTSDGGGETGPKNVKTSARSSAQTAKLLNHPNPMVRSIAASFKREAAAASSREQAPSTTPAEPIPIPSNADIREGVKKFVAKTLGTRRVPKRDRNA